MLTTDSDGPQRLTVEAAPVRLPAGYDVYYCHRWVRPDIAPSLFIRLWSMIRWADVVHLTAVYSAPTIPTLMFCCMLRKPLVWSTRGALQRWNMTSRTRVKLVWEKVCNSLCSQRRVVLHATSEAERTESIDRIPNARAIVIPNGIDVPRANSYDRTMNAGLRLLYLGRLHPIKGIENLLAAMARLREDVTLSICGDGNSVYRKHLEAMSVELGLSKRVGFHGRVEGEPRERHFKEADLCVVPSFKENFCIVVAEALARGVPVIASRGTPWARVEEVGCGLWVDNDEASLAEAITRAVSMPRHEMGQRGRDWMEREYSWETIAEQMADQYRQLVEPGEECSNEVRHSQAA